MVVLLPPVRIDLPRHRPLAGSAVLHWVGKPRSSHLQPPHVEPVGVVVHQLADPARVEDPSDRRPPAAVRGSVAIAPSRRPISALPTRADVLRGGRARMLQDHAGQRTALLPVYLLARLLTAVAPPVSLRRGGPRPRPGSSCAGPRPPKHPPRAASRSSLLLPGQRELGPTLECGEQEHSQRGPNGVAALARAGTSRPTTRSGILRSQRPSPRR